MYFWLAWNSNPELLLPLCLLSAEIKGIYHNWIRLSFLKKWDDHVRIHLKVTFF